VGCQALPASGADAITKVQVNRLVSFFFCIQSARSFTKAVEGKLPEFSAETFS